MFTNVDVFEESHICRSLAGFLPHFRAKVLISPETWHCNSLHFACFQGNLRPEEALQALTIYEGKFGRLKDDREKCAKAKEALELTDTGLLSGSEERVQVCTAQAEGVGMQLLVLTLPLTWAISRTLPDGDDFYFQSLTTLLLLITGGFRRITGPQRRLVRTF